MMYTRHDMIRIHQTVARLLRSRVRLSKSATVDVAVVIKNVVRQHRAPVQTVSPSS